MRPTFDNTFELRELITNLLIIFTVYGAIFLPVDLYKEAKKLIIKLKK